MNTPTHILTAMALLSRRDAPKRNGAVLAGALIPDIAIYLWAPWQRWGLGRNWSAIWDIHYFETPMQAAIAVINSIPLYIAVALIGFVAMRQSERAKVWGALILAFALAALIHLALDLPVHASDAYRHFWPISDWRFYSPISYWEVDRGARWISLIDCVLAFASAIVLWRRFPKLWVKVALTLAVLFSLAMALAYQFAAIQVPS